MSTDKAETLGEMEDNDPDMFSNSRQEAWYPSDDDDETGGVPDTNK